MSYKGYSFNLHKEDDKDLINWLNDKKVTKTIKIALYNQMRSESVGDTGGNSMELLSVIKKAIEVSASNNEQPAPTEKQDIVAKQNDCDKSLSSEDAEDFEKIFDI